VAKAIQKLPADRFPTAASFAEALVRPGMVDTTEYRTAAAPVARRIPRAAIAAGLVVVAALAGFLTVVVVRPSGSARIEPVGRFVIPLPEEARHTVVTGTTIALSPDGARAVYVGLDGQGNRRLFLRGLDQVTPSAIQGSELALQPFVAPDGLWVGFFRQNRIYKVPLTGGPVLPIAAADSGMAGASWGPTDQVVFATQGGLRLVPAAGGAPVALTVPDSGEAHRWPEFLPDGRHVLFTIRSGSDRLALVRVADGHITRFEQFGSHPRYVDAGYVVQATLEGTVLAVPFDARRLRVTGPAVPLVEGVSVGTGGASRLGVARNGTLVYATGGGGGARAIVRVSREGVTTPLTRELRDYAFPRVSPDGRRLAVAIAEAERSDIWTYDIEQGVLTRLTFDGSATRPFWTPDGRRIAFTVGTAGDDPDVFWVLADGSGVPEPLLAGPGRQLGDSWSPDGRTLLVHTNTAPGQNDIALLQLPDSGPATPLLATPADEAAPAVSPDGRWLAFTSNESLRYEVYLRSFPELGAKIQVSVNGGTEPRWSPTGRELFYRDGDRMMVVPVQFTPALRLGPRTELFRGAYPSNTYFPQYDVTPDGQHFVFPQGQDDGGTLVAVLHWFDQFRSRR
jgi:serine/threonine-protein kinase